MYQTMKEWILTAQVYNNDANAAWNYTVDQCCQRYDNDASDIHDQV